ncbi:MAG: hypothetical protein HYY16_19910 [Planctomycetes bacterium]|nr:hypothetical protein [Planctomycetota bacterium]
MLMKRAVLAALVVLALACGGGSGGGGGNGPASCDETVLVPPESPVNLTLESTPGTGTGGSGGAGGLTTTTSFYQGRTYTYSVYVPSSYTAAVPTPILYALHGSGGDGAGTVAAWTTQADAGGFIVAGLSSQISTQWHSVDDATTLDGMQLELDAAYNIDTTRRYLSGFSAGAHFSYLMALEHPEYYAAFAPIAGGNLAALPVPRKIPAVIVHGRTDPLVPVQAALDARDELYVSGHVVVMRLCDRGHDWDAASDNPFIWGWLRRFTLGNPS